MYLILLINSWILVATFAGPAPTSLTIGVALLLSALCGLRIFLWLRLRRGWKVSSPTHEMAIRELRRTNVTAPTLTVAFLTWAYFLFPYGGVHAQSHLAFFIMVSLISTMICLIHIPSAALSIAGVSSLALVGFAFALDDGVLQAMTVNYVVVAATMSVIIVIHHRNVTHLVNAQTEARQREHDQHRLMRMINDMPVAVMTVEPDTLNINYANEASHEVIRRIEHLLPIKADKLLGTSIDAFHRHPEHQRRILSDQANLPYQARINLGPEVLDLRVSAVTGDDGGYLGPMLTWAIVTKEVEAERRIHQLAHFDPLTGLANRVTFRERMEAHLASEDGRGALLFIDLDGFKLVNDTKGHHVGDALLRQVADRLRGACSVSETTIGRLGGDEFAVLIPEHNTCLAAELADSVIATLSETYHLDDDRQVRIGASIGVAMAPDHGANAGALLARADMALYAAKAAGKGVFKVFEPAMETRVQERVRLEAKLRDALDSEQGLFVFYQPIVEIGTGRVTAREALARWRQPQRGWIPPGEFIPVAEESGLIDRLGLFVLNQACREATRWTDGARVAVNVSAAQLGKGTLVPTVLAALANSGLSPERLEIEITETALLNSVQDTLGDLRHIRAMGVRVALDDFGTGYSSLAHLRVFPFDKIKIDGSFVKDAVDRPDCAAVVRAVAELGDRLGVTTVAEGVETQAHLDRVAKEGCTEVQGYFFGRPEPCASDLPIIEALEREVSAA